MSTQGPGTRSERTRSVMVDGARVACWESGPSDGEPVLLLHGYPASHDCWRHQVPELSREHRVIAPDLLGWGRSDRPLGLRFDYATEVARLGRLLDALDCPSVNLAGHDYGASSPSASPRTTPAGCAASPFSTPVPTPPSRRAGRPRSNWSRWPGGRP